MYVACMEKEKKKKSPNIVALPVFLRLSKSFAIAQMFAYTLFFLFFSSLSNKMYMYDFEAMQCNCEWSQQHKIKITAHKNTMHKHTQYKWECNTHR